MKRGGIFFWSCLVCEAIFATLVQGATLADEKARMGYLQGDLHQLAAFVALDKGFFKEEGVDVEVAGVFKAGPELMSAFASGDLDFGYVGEAPATIAVANKAAHVKIIAQANLEGSAIVVRKDSDLKGLQDLLGKTVAVPGYGTVQEFLFRKALVSQGIPIRSVNTIIIKPPEMIPALSGKQIDAFVAWEPYPAKAVTSGVGEILVPSGKIWPKHPCCVLVADNQFIEKAPHKVKGILRAHVRATKLIQEAPEEAVRIGARFTGMDPETIKLAMSNVIYEFAPDVEGLVDYVKFLGELGQIKGIDPHMFVKGLIRSDFLAEISGKK
jgi:NitT/TauT family transport system substrate-binding protein